MNQLAIIEAMNNKRELINSLEAEDYELGKKLLNSITDAGNCLEVLRSLKDSVSRIYVADKLRQLRKAQS